VDENGKNTRVAVYEVRPEILKEIKNSLSDADYFSN
jgi:hypothetical protein